MAPSVTQGSSLRAILHSRPRPRIENPQDSVLLSVSWAPLSPECGGEQRCVCNLQTPVSAEGSLGLVTKD